MDLSIILLNYNTKDFLLPCIKGVIKHTAGLDYEIIVVDNCSTDGSRDYIKQKLLPRFPKISLLVAQTNRGYAAGNNLGIKTAIGRYLLIMNPDVIVLDNALKSLVDFMDSHPRAGLAGPRLASPDGSLQYSCYRFPTPQVLFYRRTPFSRFNFARRAINNYLLTAWDHRQSQPVDWLQGSCLIIRRQALDKVGLMDERYFLYLEDTDWCRRFWQANFSVWYLADIELIHYHQRASSGQFYKSLFNKMVWTHLISSLKYFWKWGAKNPQF